MDNKKRRRPSSSDQKKLDGKPIGDATSGVRHKSGENGRGHNEEGRKTPSVEGGKGRNREEEEIERQPRFDPLKVSPIKPGKAVNELEPTEEKKDQPAENGEGQDIRRKRKRQDSSKDK